MQRYFVDMPLTVGQTYALPETVRHHWLTVMRAQPGAQAELVADNEQLFQATLQADEQALITAQLDQHVELPVHVTLAAGLPKQDKAEWVTQKATELGVDRIIFFGADWSIAKWSAAKAPKKLARLTKIAWGAAEQAHRVHRPTVTWLPDLAAVLAEPATQRLVAYEESAKAGETSSLVAAIRQLAPGDQLLAVVGPEGGISPQEIALATAASAKLVGLGPRILRTETAPLYLLSAVSVLTELNHPLD